MKLQHSPTYTTSLQLYLNLLQSNKGYHKSVTFESSVHKGWSKEDIGHDEYTVRQELTIVERGLLQSLGSRALRMVLRLMDELCMNNALWYQEPKDSDKRVALKELRDKGIIFKTEDSAIHYVNPVFIRRGSVMSVVAQTTHVLENMSRVNRELIRDLNYKSVKLSQMDQLNL